MKHLKRRYIVFSLGRTVNQSEISMQQGRFVTIRGIYELLQSFLRQYLKECNIRRHSTENVYRGSTSL